MVPEIDEIIIFLLTLIKNIFFFNRIAKMHFLKFLLKYPKMLMLSNATQVTHLTQTNR